MKSKIKLVILLFLSFIILVAFSKANKTPISLNYPTSWPEPTYNFSNNPLSLEGVQLGRRLFYEPLLSKDSTISCSHCHLSYTAFTHVDHKLSHGIKDRIGNRNSMSLMNLAWSSTFMWDGGINHLDMQALAPITDSREMDNTLKEVVHRLNGSPSYRKDFFIAFEDSVVSGANVLKALSQFELTLISSNSKYDKVKANNSKIEFSDQEENGYRLFQKHCNHCHAEPLFTTGEFAQNGLPLDEALKDYGRMIITSDPKDSLFFKIPSLRNLKYSFPYMHDGRFSDLRQVVNHYNINRGLNLSANEKIDLIAFLLSLTDQDFVFNPDLAYPR